MYERYHERSRDRDKRRPDPPQPHTGVNAVLALQRAIGNHGTTQVLARETDKNRPNFPHSVKIGKLGPIDELDPPVKTRSAHPCRCRDVVAS